jgi:hypothetical protein
MIVNSKHTTKPNEQLIKIGSIKILAWKEENSLSPIREENKKGMDIPKINAGIIPIKKINSIWKR